MGCPVRARFLQALLVLLTLNQLLCAVHSLQPLPALQQCLPNAAASGLGLQLTMAQCMGATGLGGSAADRDLLSPVG